MGIWLGDRDDHTGEPRIPRELVVEACRLEGEPLWSRWTYGEWETDEDEKERK